MDAHSRFPFFQTTARLFHRMPSATRMRSDLKRMLTARDNDVRTFVLAWCVNGETIGHLSLKDIVTGDSGSIHLHMWPSDLRGKRSWFASVLSRSSSFV
jgi:hypothetical protein